jgi:uncharacterized membrane protein YGL010W
MDPAGAPTASPEAAGRFRWKQRMGVHEAYHRTRGNRLVHWACIPLELWAVTKLLSLVPAGPLGDGALVVIALVAPVYLLTEPLLGALMVLFLLGCRALALVTLAGAPLLGGVVAALVFAVTFATQLRVGHGHFEAGLDDTDKNLAELRATKNPIPILLVFYYHLVELALAAGYRPALKRDIDAFAAIERAAIEGARTGHA